MSNRKNPGNTKYVFDGPSQICGCPFGEPRVFTIAHINMTCIIYRVQYIPLYIYRGNWLMTLPVIAKFLG